MIVQPCGATGIGAVVAAPAAHVRRAAATSLSHAGTVGVPFWVNPNPIRPMSTAIPSTPAYPPTVVGGR